VAAAQGEAEGKRDPVEVAMTMSTVIVPPMAVTAEVVSLPAPEVVAAPAMAAAVPAAAPASLCDQATVSRNRIAEAGRCRERCGAYRRQNGCSRDDCSAERQ
jgi:hypothetical protein